MIELWRRAETVEEFLRAALDPANMRALCPRHHQIEDEVSRGAVLVQTRAAPRNRSSDRRQLRHSTRTKARRDTAPYRRETP